jgi:hypothetical protein
VSAIIAQSLLFLEDVGNPAFKLSDLSSHGYFLFLVLGY